MALRRRQFLHTGVALGAALPLAGCGSPLRPLQLHDLPTALDELQRLLHTPRLQSSAAWTWPQTLAHLAQSIEYSMTGYPHMQSALFQRTVGSAAFAWFSWRGHMQHDLSEPIPGSPALHTHLSLESCALRLITACQQFMQWTGPLQPHFAYGRLSHAQYEQAHAMHLANHFAAFQSA